MRYGYFHPLMAPPQAAWESALKTDIFVSWRRLLRHGQAPGKEIFHPSGGAASAAWVFEI